MHRSYNRIIIIFALILLAACQPSAPNTAVPTGSTSQNAVVFPTASPDLSDSAFIAPYLTPDLDQLPLLGAYMQQVQVSLQRPVPILMLSGGLDDAQKQAQTIAVNDNRLLQYTRDAQTGAPLRNEIFGVYPVRASDITAQIPTCTNDTCYRVEMYNYAQNFYLAAFVDLQTQSVVSVLGYENSQPDIPPHLTAVALEIAVNAPEIQQALGYTPETTEALMANTKTALNRTVCERSHHLCVAPTFVLESRAIWAIVDLTVGVLIGIRWTDVGSTTAITEKSLANEAIMHTYCQQETALEQDGWRLNYTLTSSDGLRISDVQFEGKPVLESVKVVDWHVSYSSTDGFGYSDAIGCPVFSQAAVIAMEPPTIEPILEADEITGFALIQGFKSEGWPLACNYYYEQRYEFYKDGRFRPVASNLGRGCGNDGTYRPVTRIVPAGDHYTFSQWDGSAWKNWLMEGWGLAADVPADPQGYQFQYRNETGGYYIVPSTGQFADGGRGDNPYVYITKRHTDRDEGDSDMPTIGPCCNVDYQQGPERFINSTPEAVEDSSLVLWYVAQMHNDDTAGSEYCWAATGLEDGVYVPQKYPCASGPMFIPINDTP